MTTINDNVCGVVSMVFIGHLKIDTNWGIILQNKGNTTFSHKTRRSQIGFAYEGLRMVEFKQSKMNVFRCHFITHS